LKKAKE